MVALHRDDETSDPRQGDSSTDLLSSEPREGAAPRRGAVRVRAITSRDIPLPRVHRSLLVDGMLYEDAGCEFAKSCLACPFSACKYDDPKSFKLDAVRRDREIARLRREHGAPIDALMRAYGLSRTQVYRALREHGALRPWVDRGGESKKLKRVRKPARRMQRAFDL
jgi:hypothetical protein